MVTSPFAMLMTLPAPGALEHTPNSMLGGAGCGQGRARFPVRGRRKSLKTLGRLAFFGPLGLFGALTFAYMGGLGPRPPKGPLKAPKRSALSH